jgi:carbonic anhydrase
MTVRFRVATAAAVILSAALVAAGAEGPGQAHSPQEALGLLKAGNHRFERNASSPVSLSVNRRQELAAGQHPFAMVLSCVDSRVPPEYVFNTGLGDIFVIRTAGEVIDRSILASVEYGAEQLHIPLLVVMGHESCGAVTAAAQAKDEPTSASMAYLLKAIRAARRQPKQEGEEINVLRDGASRELVAFRERCSTGGSALTMSRRALMVLVVVLCGGPMRATAQEAHAPPPQATDPSRPTHGIIRKPQPKPPADPAKPATTTEPGKPAEPAKAALVNRRRCRRYRERRAVARGEREEEGRARRASRTRAEHAPCGATRRSTTQVVSDVAEPACRSAVGRSRRSHPALVGRGGNHALTLHVGKLLRDSTVAHPKQIYPSDVARLPVANPVVHPSDDAAVAGREHVLRGKTGMWGTGEELPPVATNRLLPLEAGAIWRGPGVLEYTIRRHASHNGVNVMTVEGVVEAVDHRADFFGCHRNRRGKGC